jgi:hypothetical protein
MLLYRSVLIGLLGAISLQLATLPRFVALGPPGDEPAAVAFPATAVVTVAASTMPVRLDVILLGDDERIIAVDGVADGGGWYPEPGRFYELTVARGAITRTVILLVHG